MPLLIIRLAVVQDRTHNVPQATQSTHVPVALDRRTMHVNDDVLIVSRPYPATVEPITDDDPAHTASGVAPYVNPNPATTVDGDPEPPGT